MALPLVVVRDLDVRRACGGPDKADPPLVVDPDAVLLARAPRNCSGRLVAPGGHSASPRRQGSAAFGSRFAADRTEATHTLPSPDPRGVSVPERLNHDASSITRSVNNVKRYDQCTAQCAPNATASRGGRQLLRARQGDREPSSGHNPRHSATLGSTKLAEREVADGHLYEGLRWTEA